MNQPPGVAASPPPDHHFPDRIVNEVTLFSSSLHRSSWHLPQASGMAKSLPLTLPP
jgi:hypothetical protein